MVPGSARTAADLNQVVANNARRFLFHHPADDPLAEHKQILRACQAGDPGLARHLTQKHITCTAAMLVTLAEPDGS
jgi:DNA-binding GntR family transcriptional regulator